MTAPEPQDGSATPRRRWSPFTWLGVVLLATAVILGFLGAFLTTMRVRSYDPVSVAADGMTNLDVDVDSGDLAVACGPSESFVLTQKNVTDRWHMDAEGGTVRVWQEPDNNWLPQIWFFGKPAEKAALEIPQSLCEQSLTADLSVDAGSLDVKADVDGATVDVRAGSLSLAGAANAVTANVAAGSADLNIDDAEQVAVEVRSGSVEGAFTQVPEQLTADVGAGSASLALPAGNYTVNSKAEDGSVSNNLTIDSSAPAGVIEVSVDAGSVSLEDKK
ncbi:DUF4097 family beta strand repeat-containing protein [Actinomyces massiliensis]|jgi:hypothetical protein|uniref:DUF4097 family beta strand repeat-containing protein n=1 Tax=Actinomyces massiliensis TaxID=461393 RepID=UPI0028EB50F3|nr:DUF4097 family beta strand repeat-containing protein [Actinomyces massiliensis]